MATLAPYAGATCRGNTYGPSPEYSRWLRVRWVALYGSKTTRERWRPEEDERALDMRARGKTYGQIAIRVRRTRDAVAARLRYLHQMDRPRIVGEAAR